jgi:hypothetical protein
MTPADHGARPRLLASLAGTLLVVTFVAGCATDQTPSAGQASAFSVSDLTIESDSGSIGPGDEVVVTAKVTNTGNTAGTYAAVLTVDGSIEARADVDLAVGQSEIVRFRIPAGSPGDHDVRLGEDVANLHVTDLSTAAFSVSSLAVDPAGTEVQPGDEVAVSATVRNSGRAAGTFEGVLTVDGEVAGREALDLAPGESGVVRFTLVAGHAGDHALQLDNARATLHVLGPAAFELTSIAVQPNPAETGDRLDVQVGVANVGGLTGTHVVRLMIDGKSAGTSEATLAGGDETLVPFSVKSPGAGRHTIAAGDLETELVVWRIERPANGKVLVNKLSGGLGRLKVKNGGDGDAYLVLAKTSAPRKAVLGVYVRAGRTATVRGIRDGNYLVYFSQGARWDGFSRRFTVDPERRRFEDSIRFRTTRTAYTIWTLSLETVPGGNAPTEPIDEAEFPD